MKIERNPRVTILISCICFPHDMKEWLIRHMVCVRHQEHKVLFEFFTSTLPSREEGGLISWEERAIIPAEFVGVGGWVFPEVAVIDRMGLNDLVIARTAPPGWKMKSRLMAHERHPPPDYLECLRPNVSINYEPGSQGFSILPRSGSFTDDDIRRCEEKYFDLFAGR